MRPLHVGWRRTLFIKCRPQRAQRWGRHSTEVAFTLPTQPPRVQFSTFPNFFIFYVAKIYWQRHCLETVENAKGLVVDLVLVSGTLVLQKKSSGFGKKAFSSSVVKRAFLRCRATECRARHLFKRSRPTNVHSGASAIKPSGYKYYLALLCT